MEIIQHRQRHHEAYYMLGFEYNDTPGSGFSFPCDENGNVDDSKMNPASKENLSKCLSGQIPVHSTGVEKYEHDWTEPAIGKCNRCDGEVILDGFTNTCDCGVDYNMSGQELAHRSQWGCETGECLSDILAVDSYDHEDLLGD